MLVIAAVLVLVAAAFLVRGGNMGALVTWGTGWLNRGMDDPGGRPAGV